MVAVVIWMVIECVSLCLLVVGGGILKYTCTSYIPAKTAKGTLRGVCEEHAMTHRELTGV